MSYQEPSGPELLIQHTGQVFPLGTETVTIGRFGDNIIVLADPKVSAHHARLTWQPETGSFIIKDLGSEEGTYVNEVRLVEPTVLRHGDVIRMGNTRMDLRLPPPEAGMAGPPLDVERPDTSSRGPVWTGILIALLAGLAIVCVAVLAVLLLTGGRGTPDVIIQSPQAGAQISAGNEIILQATASGAKDITLLELSVDGALIASSSNPDGTSSLTVSKPWTFDLPGQHLISAQAFTANDRTSQPASVKVSVLAATSEPSETPTPEEPTETPTPTETARPEDTATPVPTAVPPPEIEYFQASPPSIDAGGCATLQWGQVTNATAVRIEPDIGGVGTPGSQQVCPIENTTYIMTAEGPGGESRATTTLTVLGGLPDLLVGSIVFVPDPAVAGQDNQVQVTIRNAGIGAAGAFNWQWQASSTEIFDGRVFGLNAGETTVETILWIPDQPYDQLNTEARVDTGDEVRETDETNNQLAVLVQVVEPPSTPETVILRSVGSLDGYWLNDGTGSNEGDILVGNGELADPFGELVARGFLSFDLASIPANATIQGVELRFYQNAVQGNPYEKLGNLVLEHVYYGSSLSDSAYNTPALDSADIATQTLPGAWYILADPTITSWVEATLQAGQPQFQLRLQFRRETDGDGAEDWISIVPGGGALGPRNQPQLTITYKP
jgi:hypothetical protein